MITQSEINDPLDMAKHRETVDAVIYPIPGERVGIPLLSADGREKFLLDINRGRIKLTKVTFQNRVRVNLELVRLDLDGPPHRNPDDEEISSPHVHVYRAGYEARWARPASEYIDSEIL